MKVLTVLLVGGASALFFAQSGQSLLDGHIKALQEAPSLTATLNVQPIGGAPATWKISFAKPNLFRLEHPEGWSLCDGKTVYFYNKKDNTWSETEATEATVVRESGLVEAFGWRAFFDKDAAKPILAAKPGATRIVKGNQVTELVLTMEGITATLLVDTKLGVARGFAFKQGETDLIVNSADIQLGKEPVAADAFAFKAPEGAKKEEAPAPGETAATYASVQALFNRTCMPCHSVARRSGGHNLSSYAGIARGVVAGNPAGSAIYTAISGHPPRMPQMRPPLAPTEVELVKKWIEAGAKQS
jgi:outer membrane lipoprotein-sorting protein